MKRVHEGNHTTGTKQHGRVNVSGTVQCVNEKVKKDGGNNSLKKKINPKQRLSREGRTRRETHTISECAT